MSFVKYERNRFVHDHRSLLVDTLRDLQTTLRDTDRLCLVGGFAYKIKHPTLSFGDTSDVDAYLYYEVDETDQKSMRIRYLITCIKQAVRTRLSTVAQLEPLTESEEDRLRQMNYVKRLDRMDPFCVVYRSHADQLGDRCVVYVKIKGQVTPIMEVGFRSTPYEASRYELVETLYVETDEALQAGFTASIAPKIRTFTKYLRRIGSFYLYKTASIDTTLGFLENDTVQYMSIREVYRQLVDHAVKIMTLWYRLYRLNPELGCTFRLFGVSIASMLVGTTLSTEAAAFDVLANFMDIVASSPVDLRFVSISDQAAVDNRSYFTEWLHETSVFPEQDSHPTQPLATHVLPCEEQKRLWGVYFYKLDQQYRQHMDINRTIESSVVAFPKKSTPINLRDLTPRNFRFPLQPNPLSHLTTIRSVSTKKEKEGKRKRHSRQKHKRK